MAITPLNTIKSWFETRKKPTQSQFHNTWDSFWHKLEKITIDSIDGLSQILNKKAEYEQLQAHIVNTNNAIGTLLQRKAIRGAVDTYAALQQAEPFETGNYVIVIADETHDNKTALYQRDGNAWQMAMLWDNGGLTDVAIEPYQSGVSYKLNEVVTYGNYIYVSLQDDNVAGVTNAAAWRKMFDEPARPGVLHMRKNGAWVDPTLPSSTYEEIIGENRGQEFYFSNVRGLEITRTALFKVYSDLGGWQDITVDFFESGGELIANGQIETDTTYQFDCFYEKGVGDLYMTLHLMNEEPETLKFEGEITCIIDFTDYSDAFTQYKSFLNAPAPENGKALSVLAVNERQIKKMELSPFFKVENNNLAIDTQQLFAELKPADIGAEPAFNKNTAFNKNFGAVAGTVVDGGVFDTFRRQINSEIQDRQQNALDYTFGGNRDTIDTTQLVSMLIHSGAFEKSSWTAKGNFEVANNAILDTAAVGKIDLCGCSIYVESDAYYNDGWYINGYTIRILSVRGNTSDGTEANRLYTYTKYGTDAGVWAKMVTGNNIPVNLDPYLYKYSWDTIFADSNGRNIKFFEGTETSPDGNAALFGFQENTGTGYGMQFGVSQRNKAFFRSKAAGALGQWNELWHNNNLPYEENSWNPVLAARNTTNGSIIAVEGSFDLRIGKYKRRGNTVYLYGNLQGSGTNAAALIGNAVVISNVPFSSKAYTAAAGSMQYSFGVAGLSLAMGTASTPQDYLYIGRNSNSQTASIATAVWGTDFGTGFFQIRFSIEYEI